MFNNLHFKNNLLMLCCFLVFSCNDIKQQQEQKSSCTEIKTACLGLVEDNLPKVMELLAKQEYEDSDIKKAFRQFKFFDDLEKMEEYLESNCPTVNEQYNEELKEYISIEGLKYLLNN